jgi:undecaprenyl pyrophosphate phosphatase UppP
MEFNWLLSILYGILSGFTTFLPISASAHQGLFLQLTGTEGNGEVFRLAACIGALIFLLFSSRPTLSRFRREQKIASIPAKRRRRQPDPVTLRQIRQIRVTLVPMVLCAAGGWFLRSFSAALWFLAAAAVVNGIMLYLPQFFRRGNKAVANLSYLDSLLGGLGCGLAFVPGLSGIGCGLSVFSFCGSSRQTALDMGLLLMIPVLSLVGITSVLTMFFTGTAGLTFGVFLCCILAAGGAALGAWVGILLMRFLAVNIGYSGFAYYSWGMGLLMFILYLSI